MRTGNTANLFRTPDLRDHYWLTRVLFLRFLGLIYCFAFLVLAQQVEPLIGADGLLPAHQYLEGLAAASGSGVAAFVDLPTIFWVNCSDDALRALAYLGLGLSVV